MISTINNQVGGKNSGEIIWDNLTMEEFTDAMLINVIREALAKYYYRSPQMKALFELDDLVQDCTMWFYQNTRDGMQRLEKYKISHKTVKHLVNAIKSGCKQYIPAALRLNEIKNAPDVILNKPVDDEVSNSSEVLDFISSDSDSVFMGKYTSVDMQVRLSNMIGLLNHEQRIILNDITSGYTKTELRAKYKNFDTVLTDIKDSIYLYYLDSDSSINSEFGIKYEPSRRLLLKQIIRNAWTLFYLTGNIKYFMIYNDNKQKLSKVTI